MKKWIIYSVALLYISTATQLSQLYKLPVFVSHFVEHNQGGDFFKEMKVYLVHHYGGHEMDDDWETDQKLPFMKIEVVHMDFYFTPLRMIEILHFEKLTPTPFIKFFNENQLYTHYLNSIWQPPKNT